MRLARRHLRTAGLLPALAILGGCGLMGANHEAPPPARMPPVATAPRAANGAIYQAGYEYAYFEDVRARRIGDIIHIQLREATNASKNATTETSKDATVDMAGPTLLGRPVTVNGTPVLENSVDGKRSFKGEGQSQQSNQLIGSIAVIVMDVMPNGNLVIEGEKVLALNQGEELIRVSGIIRPYDLATNNTVTSDKVANARITYAGRGALASANKQGWLSRFFNSPLYPY